jgi:diguanylate cyclase (GGDEF)-like protein/PAS domain S-box-containing protein
MVNEIYVGLMNNTCLLLTTSIIYFIFSFNSVKFNTVKKILIGIFFGLIGIFIMSNPITLIAGVIFDTRSILISVVGMFFGIIPTVIAAFIMCAYRVFIGGSGMLMGISVIVSTAGMGIWWNKFRLSKISFRKRSSWLEFYLFGLLTHIVMILCMFTLPSSIIFDVLQKISIPVIIIYPFGSFLLSAIIFKQICSGETNSQLKESEEKFRSYIKDAPDGVVIFDSDGLINESNVAVCKLLGYSNEELLNMHHLQIVYKEDYEKAKDAFVYLIENSYYKGELRLLKKDGSFIYVLVSATKISDDKLLIFVKDITERKLYEEKIEYISYHNALTGLCNRRKFEIELENVSSQGIYPVSIIMGDVNGLKLVNNAFGHDSGDNILKKIAKIMVEECGVATCISRYDGDEFAAILPGVTYDEADIIVKEIKKRCLAEKSNELMLNISFGIGTKTSQDEDLQKCCNLANERMSASKLLDAKSARSSIIANLRTAMEEKTGETQKHCERIAELAQQIGEYMGIQSFEIEYLKLLSLLHDIGKTGVPDSIILKEDKLTDDEWRMMKRHCEIGFRIANTMPELVPIADGILSHHEKWDGTGYPHSLKAEEIPLIARIVTVIDSYDAMTNDRPYRKSLGEESAINELIRCSGTQFDPQIVDLFINKILGKDIANIDVCV